ncbi:MAG: hypothetical protein V7L00_20500 [Nostoc sp.]|uniref:hypothetical protein n=1 Tax=Nostoc sp. TaxID=1180 RepID=UPI002FFA7371
MTRKRKIHIYNSTTAQMHHAAGICSQQVEKFVDYLHSFDPVLKPHEVILLAASVFNELPDAFRNDPEMLSTLKAASHRLKTNLRGNATNSN